MWQVLRPTRLLGMLDQRSTTSLDWKEQRWDEMREVSQISKILQDRWNWLKELPDYKNLQPFKKKEDWLWDAIVGPEDRATRGPEGGITVGPEDSILMGPGIESWRIILRLAIENEICPVRFWLSWDQWPLYSFHFFPFRNGNVYPVTVRHCILEPDNLFYSFTYPQVERNFAPGWTILPLLPIPDLDDEIWNFSSWWYLDEILNLKLMVDWVKILGDVGIGMLNIFCMWEGPTLGSIRE